jgi:RHS repeat-associated protein
MHIVSRSPCTRPAHTRKRLCKVSAGDLAQLTYPSGLTVFYRRNASGQITALDTKVPGSNKPTKPFIANLQYNALQMPTAWNWQHCTVPVGVTGTTPAATCAQAARQYDSAGRMTGNEFAAYGFDAASRINAITQNLYASLVSTSTATGTVTSSTSYYATPVSWSVGYDSRSRITSFNRINNPAGSNATASAAGNAAATFTYDPNSNRLSSINKVTSDTDLDGDFDQFDKASTTAQTLAIGAGTNKLLGFSQTLTSTKGTKTLSTSSQQVNYTLDAAGNLTSDGLRTFAYDATNRHSQTTVSKDGEASKITYLHNAMGQRVFKSEPQTGQTLPNETVLGTSFTNWLKTNFSWLYATAQTNATLGNSYVYADGQLPEYAMLGEYGNGGASSTGRTEYLWLPTDSGQAIPVGLFRGNRFYAVHADHLNTPRLINDDSNKAVWQWPYSAFGDNQPVGILKATTNPANAYTQDPATNARLQATSAAIVYNLRFAGQYSDSETGMFQNGFRSYMPGQASYSQFDPIGLAGGSNRRGYVGGNALMFADPYGLYSIDEFGSDASNAVVGFGDGVSKIVTLGLYSTADARRQLGIEGNVNMCSASYTGGKYAGYAWGVGTAWAAGLNGGANSVFWSGSGNMLRAQAYGKSLEMTLIGRAMNFAGEKTPYWAWKAASATYAANASGVATKIGEKAGNIWRTIEQPILNLRNIPINVVP